MPVFQVGLDDGRTLRIEADDQKSALDGAQHYMAQAETNTGFAADARQGFANVVGGIGETLNQYGPTDSISNVGKALTTKAAAIAPEGYKNPDIVSKDGVSLSNLPHAVMENAPGMGMAMTAAKLMPGGPLAKLLAGSAVYALQGLGNKAKERAANNEHAQPTTQDKVDAAAAEVPEALIGSVGLSRFIPGGAIAKGVGKAGVMSAIGKLGKTAAVVGGSSAAQDAVGQLGNTLGTAKGVDFSPVETANAAATGAATGGAFGLPTAASDVLGAAKYRHFGGANADAVASVANDIQNKAGGAGSLDPNYFYSRAGKSYEAVSRAEAENTIALKSQIKELKQNQTLDPDAQHALDRAVSGEHMSETDHTAIANAVQNAPNGDLISFLARKAAVFPSLKSMGDYSDSLKNFAGGGSGRLVNLVREHIGKTLLAGLFGAESGSHLIAYSPTMLTAAGLGGMGLRSIDMLTGNLNPAARFINKFADPSVMAPVVNGQQGNTSPPVTPSPWGTRPPSPSVPSVRNTTPYGLKRVPTGYPSVVSAIVQNMNRTQRQQNKQTVARTMPLVAKLAAQQKPVTLPDNFAQTLSNPNAASRVPADVLKNGKNLIRALVNVQKMKQQALGEQQANSEATSSPLVDAVGGINAVANPIAGKRMSQIISAANAIKRLRAQPEEEQPQNQPAEPVTQTAPQDDLVNSIVQKVVKANGKVSENDEPFPKSSYAHLSPADAANQITDNASRAGTLKFKSGFYRGTLARIHGERAAMAMIGQAVQGLPIAEITAQLEGVPDQKTAKAFREHMKSTFPNASAAFDQYLSDDKIAELWKRKG